MTMNSCEKKPAYRSKSSVQKIENSVTVVSPVPPEAQANSLASFSVTSDSVVATAIIVVDPSHQSLTLHWGDDQTEVINLRRLRLQSSQVGEEQELNTLRIQHVYQTPFDQGRRILVASMRDRDGRMSYETAVIEIEKRYKFNLFSLNLEFPDHLDSIWESVSEIEARLSISQGGETLFERIWNKDVITQPQIITGETIRWRLDESQFSEVLSESDEPIVLHLDLMEHDGLGEDGSTLNKIWDVVSYPFRLIQYLPLPPVEFDDTVFSDQFVPPLEIHPNSRRSTENSATAAFRIPPNEGRIYAKFRFEVTLLVPLDPNLQRVISAS